VLVPSLAILFGLVLRGGFDEEVASAEVAPLRHTPSAGRPSPSVLPWRLAPSAYR